VRQAEKPKQVLKLRQKFVVLLMANHEARTPVARTLGTLGHFIKDQKASLEIFPTGEYIVDAIVVPFV